MTTPTPDPTREALEWYGEQSRLARLIHSEGDAGRHALAADGGKRARAALAAAPQPAPASNIKNPNIATADREALVEILRHESWIRAGSSGRIADALLAAGWRRATHPHP